jgi:hypothetical protein
MTQAIRRWTFCLDIVLPLYLIFAGWTAAAQTPVALPMTMTTLAGGLAPAASYAVGATCPGTSATMSSAYGDNCPSLVAAFTSAGRGGVAVDAYGNVIVADDKTAVIHLIDGSTKRMTVLAGGGTVCSTGKLSSAGDGCLASTQTILAGPRGIGTDPYGNVIIPEYSQNLIHLVCRYPSPLCSASPAPTTANPIQVQIGSMGVVGGCIGGTASTGTSGAGYDGTPGFSTYTSTATNTASYPTLLSGAASAFKNAGSCSKSLGEVYAPRAANADIYGNIYYADTSSSRTRVILGPLTSSFFKGSNPLYAALEINSGWTASNLKPGYVYTVVNVQGTTTGTTTATVTTGSSCKSSITGGSTTYNYSGSSTALDTHSDGCPFFDSSVTPSSGYTATSSVDGAGNLIFTDPGSQGALRVFFVQGWASASTASAAGATGAVATAGVNMYNAILKNNTGITPTAGYIYALAGGSGLQASATGSTLSTTPTLGNSTQLTSTTMVKTSVSPQGNIYIGDGTRVLFYDIYNGTIRTLLSSGAAVTTLGGACGSTTARSVYSDGCPVANSSFGNSNGLGVAVDAQGNLYLYDNNGDTSNMLVREILAQGFGSQSKGNIGGLSATVAYPLLSLGQAQTQSFTVHFPNATANAVTVAAGTDASLSYTTPACTWYSSLDNSLDCTLSVTYTPTAVGAGNASLLLTASGGETFTLNLSGTVAGAGLAIDNATSGSTSLLSTTSLLSGYAPSAVTTDAKGNVYAAIGSGGSYSIAELPSGSTSAQTLASGLTAQPTALAVDANGDVFYLDGSSTVKELAATASGTSIAYTSTTLSYTTDSLSTAHPVALTVDSAGNLYVADNQSGTDTIYKISLAAENLLTQTNCNYAATSGSTAASVCQSSIAGYKSSAYSSLTFGKISALAMDGDGTLYVADSGNTAVYALTPYVATIYGYNQSTVQSSVTATGLATDAAGDLYVQTTAGVTMIPISGSAARIYTASLTTPAGIAVDGAGNVYVADSGASALTRIARNSVTENFGSDTTLAFSGTLTNFGNVASAEQSSAAGFGEEAGDFSLAGSCPLDTNLLSVLSSGLSCTLTAQFPAIGSATETDVVALGAVTPATTTIGALTLTGVANIEGYTTTTTIGTPSPAAPVYASTGTEVSIPITVTANSSSSDGSVTNNTTGPTTSNYVKVSVDAGTATKSYFTTSSGLVASVNVDLSGLAAGTHTIAVSFPQQGSFFSSVASTSVTITTQATALSWTPGATTQQVSAAIGANVLNAAESSSRSGNVIYAYGGAPSCSATGATDASGNAVTPIDAATYLPIGSYTLYATFCPTDATDYGSSSASISYTVTQAATTAAIGASTNVVASDGTGNYTSLAAALVALPVTGGTIYIKPGTYNEQNAISYPNVALRGLGGDATKVILSGNDGAFSSPFTGYLGSGTGSGNANASGDQGSSTLDVAKGYYMGQTTGSTSNPVGLTSTTQHTPNNFYAENLTIQNTYNYDTTTSTYYTYSSSACSLGSTSALLQSLYNTGTECNSQALALWITSDQAILNNVNLYSQQDTLYAGSQGLSNYYTVARQYMWKGLISGNVDYVFGDAALVFDHTNFFTTWHGTSATGTETIEAQNKKVQTGSSADYLSGYICNRCTLMSQSTGMTNLYYGRPYGAYSTWLMLNSAVDQVNKTGWIEFSGDTNLPTSTYGEYNTTAYTDPAVGTAPYPAKINGITPVGGNTGSGATSFSAREGTSTSPGTAQNANTASTLLTAAQAAPYYPTAFLSSSVQPSRLSYNNATNWDPVATLASKVNGFVPTTSLGGVAYGTSVTILGRPQTPGAGVIPSGSYAFYDSVGGSAQSCTAASTNCTLLASGSLDASGEAYLTTSALAVGKHSITMTYGGDSNFTASTSSAYSFTVIDASLTASSATLMVSNTSSTAGDAITGTVAVTPTTATGTATLYLDGATSTSCTLTSGACSWSVTGPSTGAHTLYAVYSGDSANGTSQSGAVSLVVSAATATGDTRTVTEPALPTAICQSLTATLASNASHDLDASVDATNTNPDGARIQAAINACAGTGQAVELSMDATGTYDAFLTGPLSLPSNTTLVVDPRVNVYFSRNVQDYDKVSGTHTCGTINGNSATGSCSPLIDIPKTATNVAIMGYGKLNGRGGDALLNTFTSSGYAMPSTPTWWNLAAQANGEGNQQNPRFLQMEGSNTSITLYKITLTNSPNFHVASNTVTGFTAWDVKIITPSYARNTDGIDPGTMTNVTIANSWISDGDDNFAIGKSGNNLSFLNNHLFAGHGASIGSYTQGGVSNVLFDGNMSAGNSVAGVGSAIAASSATINGTTYAAGYADTNSTSIHIKSANDRGGTLTNIQYSNSCFLNHKADIAIDPYYSSGDGTSTFPNFKSIVLRNLVFQNSNSSYGTVQLTGEYNSNATGGTEIVNPLGITFDNVTFPSALSSLVSSTSAVYGTGTWGTGNYSGGVGQYVNMTIGPGTVSSNFLSAYALLTATASNNDTLVSNVSLPTLNPPTCTYTYLAPELTGPKGLAQTISYGASANLVVLLTPAVGGAAYPTGTVTVNDTTTGNSFAGTLSGTSDALVVTIPVSDLTAGTHTFTATYLGDANYTIPASYQSFGSYVVTVAPVTPAINWTQPSGLTYGTALASVLNATATANSATVAGSFAYTATSASGVTQAVTTSTVLTAGTWTLTATFTPTDTTNYTTATANVMLVVSNSSTIVNWTQPSAISYGATLAGVLNATATANDAAIAGSFVYTATSASGSTQTVTASTVLAAGSWTLTATFTPTDTTDYATATGSVTLVVGQSTPTIAASTSAASMVYENTITLTAKLSSTVSTPTGTVSFLDGSAVLGTATLSGGTATLATSALAVGTHSITAKYAGDSNFVSVTSSAFAESIISITLGTVSTGSDGSASTGSGATQSVEPGGTASFLLPISTTSTALPIDLTLSVSGLPTGATATLTPSTWTQLTSASWKLPAGTVLSGSVQLDVKLLTQMARVNRLKPLAPLSLALLLLPFWSRIRRARRQLVRWALLLILAGGLAASMSLSGCGGGYFAQQQKSYTVTVTIAAGSLSQSTNLTLNVE